MKLFYSFILTFLVAIVLITLFDYLQKENKVKMQSFFLTKFFYMSLNSNFYEPSSYDKSLSKKVNRAYPQLMQINKLDYIYE